MSDFIPTYNDSSTKVLLGTTAAGVISLGNPILLTSCNFPALPGHSVGNSFTVADVGNFVTVLGAGPSGNILIAKIMAYHSPSEVVIDTPASVAVTNNINNVTVYRKIPVKVGTVHVDQTLTARDTADFVTEYIFPIEGQPVLFTTTDPLVGDSFGAFFGGQIDSVEVINNPGTNIFTYNCKCVSWEVLCDTRVMLGYDFSGQQANVIVQGILQNLYNDFCGLFLSGGPFPTVLDLSIGDYTKISDAIDSLLKAINTPGSGFYLKFDAWRRAIFGTLQSTPSPWGIDETTGTDGNIIAEIRFRRTREKYYNHAYVQASKQLSDPVTVAIGKVWHPLGNWHWLVIPAQTTVVQGNGLPITEPIGLPYTSTNPTNPSLGPAVVPILVINGSTQHVTKSQSTDVPLRDLVLWSNTFSFPIGVYVSLPSDRSSLSMGQIVPRVFRSLQQNIGKQPDLYPLYWEQIDLKMNDPTADWQYDASTGLLWTDHYHSGVQPTDTISITYETAQAATPVFSQYDAGVNERSSVEGGLGYHEEVISYDQLVTPGGLADIASAAAQVYGQIPQELEVKTYRGGLKIGQSLVVNLPSINLNLTMLITDVVVDFTEDYYSIFQVKAVYGSLIGDWATAFAEEFGGSVEVIGSGGEAASLPSGSNLVLNFSSTAAHVGQFYSAFLQADGGYKPYTYAIVSGSLPAGLTLQPGTGEISGTPTTPSFNGPIQFTVSVTDSNGQTVTANFSITVAQATGAAPNGVPSLVNASDDVAARWTDGKPGALHAVTDLTIHCSAYPTPVTIWTHDPTNGYILHEVITLNANTSLKIGDNGTNTSLFVPPTTQTWTVWVATGVWDSTTDPSTLGSTAMQSSGYSVGPVASSATGATIAITNQNGIAPTTANVFMGNNSLGNPYGAVVISVQTPGKSDINAFYYDVYLAWTDGAGNLVNPGGVSNTSGWQKGASYPNDGQKHYYSLLFNYPAGDYYLRFIVVSRGREAQGTQPPFTGDTYSVPEQWPGGLTYYLLHVGLPQYGSPSQTSSPLQITNVYGHAPVYGTFDLTAGGIYMGINSIGNPYWNWIIGIQTAGNSDINTDRYELWGAWTDSSGNLVSSPGGVANSGGWQYIGSVPNDGTYRSFSSLGYNYPGSDLYFTFQVWARNRLSTSGSGTPPFTSDSYAKEVQWPGGASQYILHVGLPPGSMASDSVFPTAYVTARSTQGQNNNPAASLISDPSFEGATPGQVTGPGNGSLVGPGSIPSWSLVWGGASGNLSTIYVENDGGNSGQQYVRLLGPFAGLQSAFNVQPNLPVYVQVYVRSKSPYQALQPLSVTVYWLDKNGFYIGSSSIGSVTAPQSAWVQGPSATVQAPAGTALANIVIQNNGGENSTTGWDVDDVYVQQPIQQTNGGQTIDTIQAAGIPNSAFRARSVTTVAEAIYGQAAMFLQDASGGQINAQPRTATVSDTANGSSAELSAVAGIAAVEAIASAAFGTNARLRATLGGSHVWIEVEPNFASMELSDGTHTLTLTPTTSLGGWNPSQHTGLGRSLNFNYQNTSGKPMVVAVTLVIASPGEVGVIAAVYVGTSSTYSSNPLVAEWNSPNGLSSTGTIGEIRTLTFVVPAGGYYYVWAGGNTQLVSPANGWTEWY